MNIKKILGLSLLAFSSFQGQASSLEENNEVIVGGRRYPISSTTKIEDSYYLRCGPRQTNLLVPFPIPENIGNLSNLITLDIYKCNLIGKIPESIGNLSNLTTLKLFRNQLIGKIPESIGNLSNLTTLDLSSNQLTGKIPESIGNLSNLTTLDLSSNQLTGNIPESIGNLRHLTTLDLSSNQLTGNIPESIGNLSNLTTLDLSSNQLTGMYPNLFTLSGVLRLEYNHLNLVPGSQTPISVKSDDVTIGVGGELFNPKLFNCFEEKAGNPVKFHLSDLPVTKALEDYCCIIWFKKEKDAEGNEKDIIQVKHYMSGDSPGTNPPLELQEALDPILSEKNFRGDTRKNARSDLSS